MITAQVDHVIGVDPDRDRITVAVVDAATTGIVDRFTCRLTLRATRK